MKEFIIKTDDKGNIVESKPYDSTKTAQKSLLGDIGTVKTENELTISNDTFIKLFLFIALVFTFFLVMRRTFGTGSGERSSA